MDNFWTKNESAFVHGFRTQKALFLSIFLFLLKRKGQRTKEIGNQHMYKTKIKKFFVFHFLRSD